MLPEAAARGSQADTKGIGRASARITEPFDSQLSFLAATNASASPAPNHSSAGAPEALTNGTTATVPVWTGITASATGGTGAAARSNGPGSSSAAAGGGCGAPHRSDATPAHAPSAGLHGVLGRAPNEVGDPEQRDAVVGCTARPPVAFADELDLHGAVEVAAEQTGHPHVGTHLHASPAAHLPE